MSNKLPYEQQIEDQLMDLPLPDENAAWEDMRSRLEEDDDDGIIPIWLRGCGLWGLIGIIILAVGLFFIFSPFKQSKKNQPQSISTNDDERKENGKDVLKDTSLFKKNITNRKGIDTASSINKENLNLKSPDKSGINISNNEEKTSDALIKKTDKKNNRYSPQQKDIARSFVKVPVQKNNNDKNNLQKKSNNNPSSPSPFPNNQNSADTGNKIIKGQSDELSSTVSVPMQNKPITNDSLKTNNKDSANKKEITSTDTPDTSKKDSTKKEKIFFSAGIGLQQQIPINGQKLVAYSSLGRNNLLADYVPSVYFQVNKPKSWFAYAGFRYGAPQYNKEFTFDQHITIDTAGQVISTTTSSLSLKKTFYHQLPVSFNYHILPKWSVGAGVIWNKFYGAVADHQISKQTGSSDSVIKKEIVAFKSDSTSSISKSYFQALIETQYNWKRFYFGARYSFGLQPYIKFSLPGGAEQKERNSSLQLFIRYDLWRSKAK